MGVRGVGVDEGTASVKVVQVEKRGGVIVPLGAASASVESATAGFDPAELVAEMRTAGIKAKSVVAGLTGKDLVVRYHQVPTVPDWQLRKIMDFEIQEIQNQSGDSLAADFNLLPVASDLSSDDTVLLALTREERVDERCAELKSAGLKVAYFSPNSLGLFHAFRLYGPAADGDVVLVSIGKSCSDIAIVRDGELLYARSVNTAGDALTEALSTELNVSATKAESLKQSLGDLRPRDKRRGLNPQQEKVSHALEQAAGRLFQMVQSTLQFARTQIQLNQLEPTALYLTGGSARMKGLDEYLSQSLDVPVELFDPLADADVEPSGPANTVDCTVALGLAVMQADSDAYSVEVLGAPSRRAKEFQERHVFSVLAVLAVVVYLSFLFVQTKEESELASKDARALSQALKKRKSSYLRLQDAIEESQLLAEQVDQLEKRRAAGESLARSMRLLSNHIPEELWLSELRLDYLGRSGGRGALAREPEIRVSGKGRSVGDRTEDDAYDEFVLALRSDLGVIQKLIEQRSTSRQDFAFDLRFQYLAQEKVDADADEEGL